MMLSILMPYIDRADQLWNTLLSFSHWYSPLADLDIVLAMDPKCTSTDRDTVQEIKERFAHLAVRTIDVVGEEMHSPSAHYNQAAAVAYGEAFVLTNPECLHAVPIFPTVSKLLVEDGNRYVVCGCRQALHVTPRRAQALLDLNWDSPRWYQHTQHRPSDYHFCTAIMADKFMEVGGFCEEYSAGVGYDDNDFRDSVLKAGLDFVRRDGLTVIHQEHSKTAGPVRMQLVRRNQALYVRRSKERGMPVREN